MSGILITKTKRIMPLDQQVWFLHLWGVNSPDDFPFSSDREMRKAWEKRKDFLLALMYRDRDDPIFGGGMFGPDPSTLRPRFWWFAEGPARLILNGAKRIQGPRQFGFFYDRQPSLETDAEALQRTGLLPEKDRFWMQRGDFQEAEKKGIAYRDSLEKIKQEVVQ